MFDMKDLLSKSNQHWESVLDRTPPDVLNDLFREAAALLLASTEVVSRARGNGEEPEDFVLGVPAPLLLGLAYFILAYALRYNNFDASKTVTDLSSKVFTHQLDEDGEYEPKTVH